MVEKLSPEGFQELYDYLKTQNGNISAGDIQNALQSEHKFTSGKVTGTIRRAHEHGLLEQVARGVYKLNQNYLTSTNGIETTINELIQNCMENIEEVVARNLRYMKDDELKSIRTKLVELEILIK